MSEQRDNSGILFKNDKKSTTAQPDYKGEIKINGVSYWLSAWIKDGKNGKFMSLAANPKEEQARQPARERQHSRRPVDDEVPF